MIAAKVRQGPLPPSNSVAPPRWSELAGPPHADLHRGLAAKTCVLPEACSVDLCRGERLKWVRIHERWCHNASEIHTAIPEQVQSEI